MGFTFEVPVRVFVGFTFESVSGVNVRECLWGLRSRVFMGLMFESVYGVNIRECLWGLCSRVYRCGLRSRVFVGLLCSRYR